MMVLAVDNLNKAFGALIANDNVNLDVAHGEVHALIGPNGAGKTTLVNQIYGRVKPDSGKVMLAGEDISRLSVARRIRKGIGRSFQITSVLMDFTVLENAMIAEVAHWGRESSSVLADFFRPAFSDPVLRGAALSILARVGLADRGSVLVGALSHGERRLLELALALAGAPRLLLLDEPMAGAGIREGRDLANAIKSFKKDTGILLIEHDMDIVFSLADRITVLVEGRVIASGNPKAIAQTPAVRRAYLGGGK